jgi:hypothetical protein
MGEKQKATTSLTYRAIPAGIDGAHTVIRFTDIDTHINHLVYSYIAVLGRTDEVDLKWSGHPMLVAK